MIPTKTIEDLISKHSNLEKDLSSGAIDKKLFAEKSKEYSDLNDIIKENYFKIFTCKNNIYNYCYSFAFYINYYCYKIFFKIF